MSMGIMRDPSSVLAGARAGRLPTSFDFKSRPLAPHASLHHLDWWAQPYRWHLHHVGKLLPHDRTRDL